VTFYGAADLAAMLAGVGGHDFKLASLGSGTAKGLVDSIDETRLQDQSIALQGTTTIVTIATGSLVGLAAGSELIDLTDAIHYRVQNFKLIDDGALTEIFAALL